MSFQHDYLFVSMTYETLHTQRLFLRLLQPSDWQVISFLRSDEVVNKYVKRPSAKTEEEAKAYIARIVQDVTNGKVFHWAITQLDNDHMIGTICLWNFSEDQKIAEVGYDLHPDYQGKGYMNESLSAILRFGFETLNLKQIEAYTQWNNEKSVKLLINNGFERTDKTDQDNSMNVVFTIGQ